MGHLAAVFTILLWGVTFISTKILLVYLSPYEILFLRFALGWAFLWLLCPVWMKWAGWQTEKLFALAGLTGVTVYFLLENIALTYTSAANVSVLVSVAPFFTGLCDWKIMKAPQPGLNFFIGFGLAISGIALVSYNGVLLSFNPVGDFLALGAALAWGLYSILVKKIALLGYGTLLLTRRIFFYGLFLMLPGIFLDKIEIDPLIFGQAEIWGNLVFLGVGASAICFAIWTFCINRIGTEAASAYIYLVPVVSVIAAAVILKETITPLCIAGCCLAIAGLAVSEFRPFRVV